MYVLSRKKINHRKLILLFLVLPYISHDSLVSQITACHSIDRMHPSTSQHTHKDRTNTQDGHTLPSPSTCIHNKPNIVQKLIWGDPRRQSLTYRLCGSYSLCLLAPLAPDKNPFWACYFNIEDPPMCKASCMKWTSESILTCTAIVVRIGNFVWQGISS